MKIIKILIALIALALTFIIPVYFYQILNFLVGSVGIGWVLSTIIIRSSVILLFIFFLRTSIGIAIKLNKLKLIFITLIGAIIGFGIPFIFAPIYELDYGMYNDNLKINNPSDITNLAHHDFISENDYSLIGFFTTVCPHCMLASERLALNVQSGQTVPVHLFFPGTKEDTERFLKEHNGTEFNYYLVDEDSTFVNLSGGSFPSIFLLNKNGETQYHWTGDELNFSSLDYLRSL